MNIYFDTEFTGLNQETTLISLGLVTEDGKTFYAEFTDYDKSQVDDWIQKNVIDKLVTKTKHVCRTSPIESEHFQLFTGVEANNEFGSDFMIISRTSFIVLKLNLWLSQFDNITIHGDVLAYDWVLFCELFGGALKIPKNIHYIPIDLSTAFKLHGVDVDVNRELFCSAEATLQSINKHNALYDAKVIKECFKILYNTKKRW